MELIGDVHKDLWGKKGSNSLVAQIAKLNDETFKIDENMHYSELWIGSYASGAGRIKTSGTALPKELPFVMKVVSINKALNIEMHPTKADAEVLHVKEPKLYKDPNHRPEMIIALTPFVGLCGFRPLAQIKAILTDIYPLKAVAVENSDDFDRLAADDALGLRNCYTKLIATDGEEISKCINIISSDFGKELCNFDVLEIFNKLKNDFPNDIGVLSIFFLNIVRLEPGEALFIGANELHAYLSGDCVECVACSDNVLRAGLTNKYRDIKNLVNLVDCKSVAAEDKVLKPLPIDEHCLLFKAPVEDFLVIKLTLAHSDPEYIWKIQQTPAILLVLSGQRLLSGKAFNQLLLKRGSILYLPFEVGTELHFSVSGEIEEEFLAYMSTPNMTPPETEDSLNQTADDFEVN
ncbi:mannose-6-phosphate isomerase [Ceratitis capitata]|uniref:mannose-6-phosphate isomerase n=1 Tax=Ceratitis capitata TaxID=7213 RepID=W8AZ58_CERCA|nr:mannose-6-phosphate isomerase [Ceratitis capitata]